ncbi:transposase [Mesorhizobium waimense]|uniref:transposase n=1 Tax=Mesorhizobium waimense TaxID=1300307 RepID=UPI001FDF9402|nr:transposase [Mesorhizobium waimense]
MVDLASAAGSSVTEVAQAFGIAPSQLYAWCKQMAGGEPDANQAIATFARIDVAICPRSNAPSPIARTRPAGSSWPFRTARNADRRDRRSDSAAYRSGGVDQVITVVPTDRIYL